MVQLLLTDCRDVPTNFSAVACVFLALTYGVRWIGRGGSHLWPSRFLDLSSNTNRNDPGVFERFRK